MSANNEWSGLTTLGLFLLISTASVLGLFLLFDVYLGGWDLGCPAAECG